MPPALLLFEQTIDVWRRRFGKLEPADVKRLRELETLRSAALGQFSL
jgi:hypothetical protein